MKKYKKFIILTILLQLIFSINLLADNEGNGTSSYGGAGDSIVIPLSAIKIANAKMMENEFNKAIIDDYKKLVEQYETKVQLQEEMIIDLKIINQDTNSALEDVKKENKINKIFLRIFEGATIVFGITSAILAMK